MNVTIVLHNLKEAEEKTAKALEYFKSTRHIVLYYEDIVRNRTVRLENTETWACLVSSFILVSILVLRTEKTCMANHFGNIFKLVTKQSFPVSTLVVTFLCCRNLLMFKSFWGCHIEISQAVKLRYTVAPYRSKLRTGVMSKKQSRERGMRASSMTTDCSFDSSTALCIAVNDRIILEFRWMKRSSLNFDTVGKDVILQLFFGSSFFFFSISLCIVIYRPQHSFTSCAWLLPVHFCSSMWGVTISWCLLIDPECVSKRNEKDCWRMTNFRGKKL